MSQPFRPLADEDILEAYFSNMQRSQTLYVVMLNTEGTIIMANRGLSRLFGKLPDELTGTSWFDVIIPKGDQQRIREEFKRILATGLPDVYENPISLPDGSTRTVLWSNSLTHDGDRLTGTLSIGIDITEHAATAQKLGTTARLLLNAERAAGLGTYVLDIKSGIWTSSAVMDSIFGIGPEDPHTVESWANLVHPDDREAMVRYFSEEVLGKKKPFDRVYRTIRGNDKATRWVHGFGVLDIDGEGTVRTMSGAILDITDSHEAAKELEQSEQKWHTIFDKAPVGIMRIGVDKKFLDANAAFLEFIGYDINELRTKTIADITHPEDLGIGISEMGRILMGELDTATVEKRYIRKDGTVVIGRTVINLVRNDDGTPAFFLPLTRDISDEKKSSGLLQASEQFHRTLVELSPIGIGVSRDGKFLFVNAAGLHMMGLTEASQIVGRSIFDFVAPEAAELFEARQKEYAAHRETGIIETKLKRQDGSIYPASIRSRTIEYQGTPAILTLVEDISDRLQATSLLHDSEERFSIAARHTKTLIYDWNIITSTIVWEGAIEELTGFSADTFPAASIDGWAQLIHPEDRDTALKQLDIAQKDLSHYHAEYRIRRNDGAYITVDDSGSFIQGASGNPVRMIGAMRDITDQMKFENRYRGVLNSMSNGFAEHEIILDQSGSPIDYRFVTVNPAFEELTGFKASVLIGRTVKEMMPTTEQVWIQRYGAVALSGKPETFTAASGEAGGKSFRVHAWQTSPKHFAVIFSDVTKEVDDFASLSAILDNTLDTIAIITPTGTCMYQNAACKAMLGYEIAELMGQNLLKFVNPLDLPPITAQLAKGMMFPGKPFPATYRFKHKDGTWHWLESLGINLLSDKHVNGILISSRDITDVKRGQETMGRVDELEAMNKAMIGRELRISELKAEVQRLTDTLARERLTK